MPMQTEIQIIKHMSRYSGKKHGLESTNDKKDVKKKKLKRKTQPTYTVTRQDFFFPFLILFFKY